MTKNNRKILFVFLIFGLILLGLIFSSGINRQLHAWKVLPEPERITELYFTDHTKLPRTYHPDSKELVSFTIHNLEYRKTEYSYTIKQTSMDGLRSATLGTGSLTIMDKEYKYILTPIVLSDLGSRCKITIQLNTNEAINFWLNRENV